MNLKEEISISVPSDLAQAYHAATQEEKEQLQLKIAAFIQLQLTTSRSEAVARLHQTMDFMSQEAQSNGLTPDILESLLNDE